MHVDYFGFRENPFPSTPDPRCIYPSATHREALATLRCSYISNRGFTALIATPGMGKTTLLRRFLDQIRSTATSVFLFDIDPEFTARDLTAYVLRDLGAQVPDSTLEMRDAVKEVLISEARAGRKFVLVIDEAQNLSDAALEMVRLMSNFETAQTKLMQIVLAGQPQLDSTLSKPSLVQFRQRISFFCRLDPLSREETGGYIAERLRYSGYNGEPLFSEKALDLVAQTAQGTPRMINTLCFNALSLCCALGKRQIDEEMVREVRNDQRLGLAPPNETPVAARAFVSAPQQRSPEPKPVVREREVPATNRRHRRFSVWKAFFTTAALLFVGIGAAICINPATAGGFARSALDHIFVEAHADSTSAPAGDAAAPVRIAANASMGSVAREYLGNFMEDQLHRLQALNPWLTNANPVEAGKQQLQATPRTKRVTGRTHENNAKRSAQ
jgi:general secretion pathway protein A